MSADAASNALQAWEMLHGNVLLRGWTVTDVSFYTNELIQYMVVGLLTGYDGDMVNLGVALTFTLLVLVVAAAAKGGATGREALWRMLLAVAVVGVPVVGLGVSVQLNSPNHTGTAIPLLLTWMVLDRAGDRRWVPWAVAGMLAWGQIADPLVMYIGAVPLLLVCGFRMVRDRTWLRGLDARLMLAAVASVMISQGVQLGIRAAGGWAAHPPTTEFATPRRMLHNAWFAIQGLAGNFGAYFPDRHGFWSLTLGVVHLVLLIAALTTTLIVLSRSLRRTPGQPGDRLAELAAIGIVVNVGAYVASTLPVDLGSSRQTVAVLPLSAVLIGRVWGPRLAIARPRLRLAAAGIVTLLAIELAVQAITAPVATDGRDVARWLESQGMRYGLGSYWYSNNITLLTGGRVKVIPVVGGDRIRGYRSESRSDWYDPDLHDARFIVLDRDQPGYGTEANALAQFGPPVRRQDFPTAVILVYEHNLLDGLPAACVPELAPSMAQCPPHRLPLFS